MDRKELLGWEAGGQGSTDSLGELGGVSAPWGTSVSTSVKRVFPAASVSDLVHNGTDSKMLQMKPGDQGPLAGSMCH